MEGVQDHGIDDAYREKIDDRSLEEVGWEHFKTFAMPTRSWDQKAKSEHASCILTL